MVVAINATSDCRSKVEVVYSAEASHGRVDGSVADDDRIKFFIECLP